LSAPQILGVPLLLLANKQDDPQALGVHEIRQDYEAWYQGKLDAAARRRPGEEHEVEQRRERIASLDVMGVSALEG
jgi:ADP-ribosylation factor related protein 1